MERAPNACTDVPGYTYYNSLWHTPLNWAFETTPQPNMNNTQMEWPRGKVLGGLALPSYSAETEADVVHMQAVQRSTDYT